tara:strand:+ start:14570 stop:17386 length:2817 start_codon:yes stop_codon:yes gene_type:complete
LIKKNYIFFLLFVVSLPLWSQHSITIDGQLDDANHTLEIQQQVLFENSSGKTLDTIYFHDWANSFSEKKTPLGIRLEENYVSSFHFKKDSERGRTTIKDVVDDLGNTLLWNRGSEVDILYVIPSKSIVNGGSFRVNFNYSLRVADDTFTRYGVDKKGNYKLRYWYIAPAVYDKTWQVYSNKNANDLYQAPTSFAITLTMPEAFSLSTGLDVVNTRILNGAKTITLTGDERINAPIFLGKNSFFERVVTDKVEVQSNIYQSKVKPTMRAIFLDRMVYFLDDKIGAYPFKKIVVSDQENKNNPVYGLNQLPSFLSPFPNGFEYDLAAFKTMSRTYLENTLLLHPRKDAWLIGAIQVHLLIQYVNTYYPNMKALGSLSNFWVIRWAHISDLEFNDQYSLLYLNMARNNIHQPLSTSRDSLTKFNKKIANDYYAGKGLQYLNDFLTHSALDARIKEFYKKYKLKPATPEDFKEIIKASTALNVDWFFNDYVHNRSTIDFKIKRTSKIGDSIAVTIINKKDNVLPVSISGSDENGGVLFKKWSAPIDSIGVITVPAKDLARLELNQQGHITEFNRRNNSKRFGRLLNRPIQLRLFQDVQDHRFNQLFFMPVFEYNLYDGFTTGMKLYNKTVLPKALHYKLSPQYGFTSKSLIGSGSIRYTNQIEKGTLRSVRYGLSGNYYSYDTGLFYKRFTPYMTFAFRNEDIRNNEKQYINLRNVNVSRDANPNNPEQDPNYSVFNVSYVYSNPNLINYYRGVVDYQISSNFSKISLTLDYRKLFENNRQINVRLFSGAFLFNDTKKTDDFFSFALDRPTDYLFDYDYYGRSEDAGLFSQQLIVAEGGFKSKLETDFANSWMTSINASTNIWRWILVYADAALVHNTNTGTKAVYDSGIRINLVQDYFEVYFPMYSSLGWEPGFSNYDQKIRFKVTLSPKTLLGLFTREWY